VVPIAYGSIERIFLYGEYDDDVYATGGEIEILLQPRSLFDDVKKIYPLSKVDISASLVQITKYLEEEETK